MFKNSNLTWKFFCYKMSLEKEEVIVMDVRDQPQMKKQKQTILTFSFSAGICAMKEAEKENLTKTVNLSKKLLLNFFLVTF